MEQVLRKGTDLVRKQMVEIQTKEGQLVVSSRQVAIDFEKRHADVIKTIEEKMEVNEILRSPKYFIESTYKDKSNRNSKEYLLTRDGFSFLVMGFTGVKADNWKLKYIEAFNKMEQALDPYKGMSPELKSILMLDKKTLEIDNRVKKLENTMTIDYSQQEELNSLARKVVVQALGGKDTPAYKELNKKAFSQIWKDYKRVLGVNSYKNTAVKDLDFARKILSDWKPNRELELMIKGANSQIRFRGDN